MLEEEKKQANEINATDKAINSSHPSLMQNQNSGDMIYALCMQSFINYAYSGFNVVTCMYRGVSRYVKYSVEVRVCELVPWQVTFIVLIKCILRLTTEWTLLLLLSDP